LPKFIEREFRAFILASAFLRSFALKWHELPDVWPNDYQLCWIRRTFWFTKPFLAIFEKNKQDFATLDGYTIPWYLVARWADGGPPKGEAKQSQ
jgi:hypothetical protein